MRPQQGSKIGNFGLNFVLLNIHFYHYLSLLIWVKSKFSNFLYRNPSLLNRLHYTKHQDLLDKCKKYFWTLHNSFFHKPCLVDSCFANPLTDTYFSSQSEQSYILISGCFIITCLILSTLESKTSLHWKHMWLLAQGLFCKSLMVA